MITFCFLHLLSSLFCLFCFVLFCFVLFCFVLFCFVLFCFVLFCFVLFCPAFVLFFPVLFIYFLFRQRAYEGIADLISKAKIKVDEQDQWVTEGRQEQEKRDFAHSKLPKHWRPIGWSPKDEDYGIIEILMEHCRYPSSFILSILRHMVNKNVSILLLF